MEATRLAGDGHRSRSIAPSSPVMAAEKRRLIRKK
jgi:hypothetical protein